MELTQKQAARYWRYVDKRGDDECWPWIGYLTRDGYGRTMMSGRLVPAHRVSYFLAHREWPDCTDHLCRNRACQNPSHLESVTHGENVRRGEGMMAKNSRKTHCIRGHELTGDNVMAVKNGRACRECYRKCHREIMRKKRRALGMKMRGNRIHD